MTGLITSGACFQATLKDKHRALKRMMEAGGGTPARPPAADSNRRGRVARVEFVKTDGGVLKTPGGGSLTNLRTFL